MTARDLWSGRTARRVGWLVGAWAMCCVLLSLMAFAPSVPLLAAVGVVVAVLGLVLDVPAASGPKNWSTPDPAAGRSARGSDHPTLLLAARLATTAEHPDRTDALTAELHERVNAVLVARLRRRGALGQTPAQGRHEPAVDPDLARVLDGPPDPRLLDPTVLDRILTRIEAL